MSPSKLLGRSDQYSQGEELLLLQGIKEMEKKTLRAGVVSAFVKKMRWVLQEKGSVKEQTQPEEEKVKEQDLEKEYAHGKKF